MRKGKCNGIETVDGFCAMCGLLWRCGDGKGEEKVGRRKGDSS